MRTGENIYKRKDGRWEARVSIGHNIYGKLCYKYLYGSTYREAKQKKQLYERQTTSEKSVVPKKENRRQILFGDVSKLWLNASAPTWKPSTYSKYESCLYKHILPKWELYYVDEITQKKYNELLMELANRNYSTATVNVVLRGIPKYLLEKGERTFPFTISSLFTSTTSLKKTETLSDTEWQTLFHYTTEHLDGTSLGILICMCEGVRIGELCALRWKDVDFSKHTLHIRETVQRLQNKNDMTPGQAKSYLHFGLPKNGNMRWIPIHPKLISLLKQEYQKDFPENFILSNSSKIVEPRTFTNRFHRILKKCGIRKVHVHLLRHSFASRCVEAGVDIKALSEILGHKTVKETMDRYVHLSLKYKQNQLSMLTFSKDKSRQKNRQSV